MTCLHAKVHPCTVWWRVWLLPLNNNINGHQSVKGEDLHEKQPHNQDNHRVCPHIDAWEQTMQTSIRYPPVSIYWFFGFSFLSNNNFLPLIFSSSWHSLSWWSEKIKCDKDWVKDNSSSKFTDMVTWTHLYLMRWCGVSSCLLSVSCDLLSNCMMASLWLSQW